MYVYVAMFYSEDVRTEKCLGASLTISGERRRTRYDKILLLDSSPHVDVTPETIALFTALFFCCFCSSESTPIQLKEDEPCSDENGRQRYTLVRSMRPALCARTAVQLSTPYTHIHIQTRVHT